MPPVRTLLSAGTQITIPSYTDYTYNFTIDQAATFQGRWDSSSTFDSYIVPSHPQIIFRPLCQSLNWTFNETLSPDNWTLWILPCDFTQNATVTIPSAAQLVYAFSTQLLHPAGNLSVDGGAFAVWNFSLPSDTNWIQIGCDCGYIYPTTDLAILDPSELAAFLGDPAGFDFSTITNFGPPGSTLIDGSPGVPGTPAAGTYAVVLYASSNASVTMWLWGPLSTFWPGPATPILVSVTVATALNTTVVGASMPVAATATDSAGNSNPGGVTFEWVVLPPTLGVLSDPSQPATDFIATSAGTGSLEVEASSGGIVISAVTPIRVAAPAPFELQLGADRSSGPVPLTVAFAASIVGAVVTPTYLWSFGDGSPGDTTPSANHTFAVVGTYVVLLTAREPWGATATSTFTVIALPAEPTGPLMAALSLSSPSPVPGATESFAASASGGTPPYTWSWRGLPTGCSAGNVSTVTCVLPTSGGVMTTVVVTDHDNRTASATAYVAIGPSASGESSFFGSVPTGLAATLAGAVVLSLLAFALALRSNLRGRRPPMART